MTWFCDLDSFGSLGDLCRLLAVNAARYPGIRQDTFGICSQGVEKFAKFQITEWTVPLRRSQFPLQGSLAWDEFLHEWFSSLWTLREVCMRPDTWLCCRDWKPLVSSVTGSKIPLDCILSLVSVNADIIRQWPAPAENNNLIHSVTHADGIPANFEFRFYEVPTVNLIQSPPPFLLYFTHSVMAAGLAQIPDINRMDILTLGNQRACTERSQQSQAIMSALGVTGWYESNNKQQQQPRRREPASPRAVSLAIYRGIAQSSRGLRVLHHPANLTNT